MYFLINKVSSTLHIRKMRTKLGMFRYKLISLIKHNYNLTAFIQNGHCYMGIKTNDTS